MEVILLEKIKNLGEVGNLVKVKDGFARNFLLPKKKVLRATQENKKYFESKRAEYEKENQEKKLVATTLADKLSKLCLSLIMQAGDDDRLYGSITSKDIIKLLKKEKDVVLQKEQVLLIDKIKEIGIHPINLKIHPEVTVKIKLNVARSKEEADIAMLELTKPKAEENFKKKSNKDIPSSKKVVENKLAKTNEDDHGKSNG